MHIAVLCTEPNIEEWQMPSLLLSCLHYGIQLHAGHWQVLLCWAKLLTAIHNAVLDFVVESCFQGNQVCQIPTVRML